MKKLIMGLLAISVVSCLNNDDLPSYDPLAQLEIDKQNIEAHLTQNGITAQEHDTGIFYTITTEGDDTFPEEGDEVAVNYELYNFDGDLLDTNIEEVAENGGIHNPSRTYEPLEFVLGTGNIISGFQISALLLSVGASGDFYIPSVLAYRNVGSTSIKPNESIMFKIELVEVK